MSVEISTSQVSYISPKISVEQIRQAHGAELDAIARYRRVTNYLAAAQIYLKNNVLLEDPLKPEHIKDHVARWACAGNPQ
jgi:xylulose-5-phosphate/fructose-6-phosphate phosphoketolase